MQLPGEPLLALAAIMTFSLAVIKTTVSTGPVQPPAEGALRQEGSIMFRHLEEHG
jgi:hypothetical protein